MLRKFKVTKAAHEDNRGAKFYLSEGEAALGMTIHEKLSNICPGFFRLDTLFVLRHLYSSLLLISMLRLKQMSWILKKKKQQLNKKNDRAQAKGTLLIQLLQQGKSAEECEEYLNMINGRDSA